MKLGLTCNEIRLEQPHYTTTQLARSAAARGHEVFYVEASGFAVQADDSIEADARAVDGGSLKSAENLLGSLRELESRTRISVDELDVLLLRNNPNEDVFDRPWARLAAIDFGLLASRHGVIVLNNPATLATSLTKLYLHAFPAEVRPATLVTRNQSEAKQFVDDHGGYAVLKPLFGFGGRHVFLVRPGDEPNLNQMLESVAEDGYIIVQEYLPDAVRGDTRLLLVNAEPLCCDGSVAALRRVRSAGDMRSNLTAGATPHRAVVDDAMLEVAAKLRPRLIADGIFLAGVDIVGDKVMEINIMTPGALHQAAILEQADFSGEVISALERKVEQVHSGVMRSDDVALATF